MRPIWTNRSSDRRVASRRLRLRGVTLLEVLLALAILGAALAAIATLTNNAINAAQRCEEDTAAAIQCQSQLDRLLASTAPIQETQWRPIDTNEQWLWSAHLSPAPVNGLMVLTVSVKPLGASTRSFELVQQIRRSRLERSPR